MRNSRLVIGVILAAVCVGAPALRAQSAANSGQIVGTVADPSTAPVAGAQITVRNTQTNFVRRTTSIGTAATPFPICRWDFMK